MQRAAVQVFEFACRKGTVLRSGDRMRLDKYLTQEFNELPSSIIRDLIKRRCVSVNGAEIDRIYHKVEFQDTIRMELDSEARDLIDFAATDFEDPDEIKESIFPEDFPLDVLFEDSDMLIVNKPAGMVVHPAPNTRRHFSGSLVNCLLHRYPWFAEFEHEDAHFSPGIVHRLDAGTSGCLAVAKNIDSWHALREQFRVHETTRIYVGFVHRIVSPAEGTIDAMLGRHPRAPNLATTVLKDGLEARTHYKLAMEFPHHKHPISLISFKLDTGRNHQIRVHMQSLLSPIVNDAIYGREKSKKGRKRFQQMLSGDVDFPEDAMALHASTLSVKHPITREPIKAVAPLPTHLKELIRFLKSRTEEYIIARREGKNPGAPKEEIETTEEE